MCCAMPCWKRRRMSAVVCLRVFRALKTGNRARRLSIEAQRDLLGLFTRSAAEWLEDWFESEPGQGGVRLRRGGRQLRQPLSPGHRLRPAAPLLRRGERQARPVGPRHRRHGRDQRGAGGGGAAAGRRDRVRCAGGAGAARAAWCWRTAREFAGRAIVANVNPKLLFLKLVDAALLERDFRERMERYKCASATFRMNVALSALPRIRLPARGGAAPRLPASSWRRRSPTWIAPIWMRARTASPRAPDRGDGDPQHARRHAGAQGRARGEPVLPALRARGGLGAAASRRPSTASSTWWKRHAPGFRQSVVGHSALSPADLEREFGLTGGDIFHGQLSLDQLWSARPVLGHADYRTPVKGLYLCGSGAHPGGGVTGAPGHNCAREVLRDFGRRMPG